MVACVYHGGTVQMGLPIKAQHCTNGEKDHLPATKLTLEMGCGLVYCHFVCGMTMCCPLNAGWTLNEWENRAIQDGHHEVSPIVLLAGETG